MLGEALVDYCAPTLAGIKTGSLFSVNIEAPGLAEEIRILNSLMVCKGLKMLLLKRRAGQVLVYLYRPEFLNRDLRAPEAECILKEKGYPCGNPEKCLAELKKHMAADKAFPHEIGLFLGYPPTDVRGFMKDPRKGVKCVGCWKVYGDAKRAEMTFEKYRKCTEVYRREYENGSSLERLIVGNIRGGQNRIACKNN